jgi:hypothetical protein
LAFFFFFELREGPGPEELFSATFAVLLLLLTFFYWEVHNRLKLHQSFLYLLVVLLGSVENFQLLSSFQKLFSK